MKEKLKKIIEISKKTAIVLIAIVFLQTIIFNTPDIFAKEEDKENVSDNVEIQTIVTPYSDLWKGTVVIKVGDKPVKWIVNVPEGTQLRGCGATIKIPGLGFGTDTHNKDEGHVTLKEGDNLVYEFTPKEKGDYLFTCWMGSGCHSNYIHVTEDGNYSGKAPEAPTNIKIERNGTEAEVKFDAPVVADNVTITEYSVIAVPDSGKRVRASGKESPIKVTGLDSEQTYTFTITAKSTAGRGKTSDEIKVAPNNKGKEEEKQTSKEQSKNVEEKSKEPNKNVEEKPKEVTNNTAKSENAKNQKQEKKKIKKLKITGKKNSNYLKIKTIKAAKVKVKVGKKVYKAKTNKKGIAVIKIAKINTKTKYKVIISKAGYQTKSEIYQVTK